MTSRVIATVSLLMNFIFASALWFLPDPRGGTLSADGFNEARFTKIQCGHSYGDVITLLGYPLSVYAPRTGETSRCDADRGCYARLFTQLTEGESLIFVYQMGKTPQSDHLVADVVFDSNGMLLRTRQDVWYD